MSDEHDTIRLYEQWWTVAEAVAATGYSAEHLHNLAREKRVKAIELEGRWYFARDILLAYKAERDSAGE